jgi:hypothetical protein
MSGRARKRAAAGAYVFRRESDGLAESNAAARCYWRVKPRYRSAKEAGSRPCDGLVLCTSSFNQTPPCRGIARTLFRKKDPETAANRSNPNMLPARNLVNVAKHTSWFPLSRITMHSRRSAPWPLSPLTTTCVLNRPSPAGRWPWRSRLRAHPRSAAAANCFSFSSTSGGTFKFPPHPVPSFTPGFTSPWKSDPPVTSSPYFSASSR